MRQGGSDSGMELGKEEEGGGLQFRYGNTPLSCGGREQNVQEKRGRYTAVSQADGQRREEDGERQ